MVPLPLPESTLPDALSISMNASTSGDALTFSFTPKSFCEACSTFILVIIVSYGSI
jgi:hypothetical protein